MPNQRTFAGVVGPIDRVLGTAALVRDRLRQAAEYIPADQPGTTDECGFSPFRDASSTTRDTACAKIRARVEGTLGCACSRSMR